MKASNPLDMVSVLPLPLVMGIAMWFLREIILKRFFFKFLVLGNLTCDQETQLLLVAWRTRTWTQGNWVVNTA